MKITLLSLVLCLFCSLNMAAQGSDIGSNPEDTTIHQLSKKELRRQKVAKRNIHYNILGGPSYTPDFGALIGGSALVTFRMIHRIPCRNVLCCRCCCGNVRGGLESDG